LARGPHRHLPCFARDDPPSLDSPLPGRPARSDRDRAFGAGGRSRARILRRGRDRRPRQELRMMSDEITTERDPGDEPEAAGPSDQPEAAGPGDEPEVAEAALIGEADGDAPDEEAVTD